MENGGQSGKGWNDSGGGGALGEEDSQLGVGHASEDSETGEVFEEAIDARLEEVSTPAQNLQEQAEVDVKNIGAGGVEIEGDSEDRATNGSYHDEVEDFEEAMELPIEDVPRYEVGTSAASEEGVVGIDVSGSVDDVGRRDDEENVMPVETNGVESVFAVETDGVKTDGAVGEREVHALEVPAAHVLGENDLTLEERLESDKNGNTVLSSNAPSTVPGELKIKQFDVAKDDDMAKKEAVLEVQAVDVHEEVKTVVDDEQLKEVLDSGNGSVDNVGLAAADEVIHEKTENGECNIKIDDIDLCLEIEHEVMVGPFPDTEADEKILIRDVEDVQEATVSRDMAFAEKPQSSQHEVSSPLEVSEKVEEGNKTDARERGLSDTDDSPSDLRGGTLDVESEHSEVIDGNDESEPAELLNELEDVERPHPNFLENKAVNDSPERGSVSVEEYEESSSADEDGSESVAQLSPIMNLSSGNVADASVPPRPAGLGSSAPLLGPPSRASQQPRANGTVQQQPPPQQLEEPGNGEAEEYDETREKLQMIRVKFLRLAHRLGQTPHNVVVAQVLYRLGLAEQLRGSRTTSRAGAFSFDRASAMAVQLEGAGQEPLDFSCTILVLGKTGVGKSATINSIFDESRFSTNAFQCGTKNVQDIEGAVQGIKVRVVDTPGLSSSSTDQRHNEKILHSVKRFIKKTPPDIVLYLDRLDMQSRDYGDVPLLRTITDVFGPSIWFNAIVVLTHAASAPPDGPNGTPLSYEMFVTQRSHVVQQAIRQAAGDVRLMNPVSLVENHSACRTNRAGQRVLPNGQVWKPQLLLLSFASKILAEANTLLKLQDSPPGKPFGARSRVPPLPFLLSSLLQSRPQLKLPEEQFGDDDSMDNDFDDTSDSEDESEYDELPPFKRLTKVQLAKLSKAQKNAYFDELEYREKLFMKKQLKEERKRRKLLKKMAAAARELPSEYNENTEEESGGAASVPVPMPDLALPTSFDSDNPTHRYRYLDSSNQWLVRPVLDGHGWDHDIGYDGLNVERLFVVKDKIPVSVSGQVTKDKKECNLQMELASSVKHGEGKATSLGLDMQTVGKDVAYTFRSETKFGNFRHNKTAAGLSVTMLGGALSAGMKIEDVLMLHKRFRVVMTGGAMTGRGEVAYGGSLEATLRDKDYPLGRTLSTLGLSIMDWHGDLAIGCNVQSQFPVGRNTNMVARANLNNRGSGQVSVKLNSSEQLQIALVALIPIIRNIIRLYGSSQPMY